MQKLLDILSDLEAWTPAIVGDVPSVVSLWNKFASEDESKNPFAAVDIAERIRYRFALAMEKVMKKLVPALVRLHAASREDSELVSTADLGPIVFLDVENPPGRITTYAAVRLLTIPDLSPLRSLQAGECYLYNGCEPVVILGATAFYEGRKLPPDFVSVADATRLTATARIPQLEAESEQKRREFWQAVEDREKLEADPQWRIRELERQVKELAASGKTADVD